MVCVRGSEYRSSLWCVSGVVNTGQVLILSVVYVKCSEYRSSLWYMSSVVNTGQVCGMCQG